MAKGQGQSKGETQIVGEGRRGAIIRHECHPMGAGPGPLTHTAALLPAPTDLLTLSPVHTGLREIHATPSTGLGATLTHKGCPRSLQGPVRQALGEREEPEPGEGGCSRGPSWGLAEAL